MSVGRELFEEDLKLAVLAAATAYDRKRFVVVGSAAILASFPEAPGFLRVSADIDMFPIRKLKNTEFQSGDEQVGQASAFEVEHDFYVERVGDWTLLSQPEGWLERCVKYTVEGNVAHCLSPLDLVYNKTEAGREKDLNFVAGVLSEGIVNLDDFEKFIHVGCPHPELLVPILANLEKIKAMIE